jgi:hypothetical protein
MSFLVVAGALALALSAIPYFTKRRLGVLGLAAVAGSTVAAFWAASLTPIVAGAGVELIRPPLSVVLFVAITLLFPLVLLFSSAKAESVWQRLIGSIVFAGLCIALLVGALGAGLVIDDTSRPVYDFLTKYQWQIVTVGIGLSMVDLLLTKKQKSSKHAR